MTTQSHPWKELLLRHAESLERLGDPHRWSEASSVKLEETVVLGFYAVRRLVNSFLLSDALVHRPVSMIAFPARRRDSLMLGDERLEDLYDLGAGKPVSHDLVFTCHQVTHNCVFTPWFDPPRTLKGVYVTSDHQRKVALYAMTAETLQALFRQVGGDR